MQSEELNRNSKIVGEIENHYGNLEVSKNDAGTNFYWAIGNWDAKEWKEISEALYIHLLVEQGR